MHSLAPREPEVRQFEATVERVDGTDVVLDRTYFYPESGGQPADRGVLGGVRLDDVRVDGAAVVHSLAESPSFESGDSVVGTVDDAFRTYCTRAHTASHVLYGAARRLLDDLGYGGFDIGAASGARRADGSPDGTAEKVRVDLATSTDVDDGTLVELERLVNRTVWDSRPVTWESVPVEEATARDDVAFNAKTEEGVMADADAVRLVDVEGWDVAACGGTHVSNTRDIGPVEVLDRSNPGEGLTRVEFAVGPVAVDRRARVHRAALDAARDLDSSVESLPDAVAEARTALDRAESEVAELKREVLDARLADMASVERDGATWRVGVVEGFGPNEVADPAKALAGEAADVVAVVGESGATFVVVASDGAVDAADVVSRVTDAFGGGGGGGATFAQGGGLDADPEAVGGFLRD